MSFLFKNITINGRRTGIRIEPEMWDALEEICRRENTTPHQFATKIAKRTKGNLTSALRVAVLQYFRSK
jgi:predicted DNA-binding ribbon-helix-helix protein